MCKFETSQKTLVLRDKAGGRSELRVENPDAKKLIKWDIDGCVIKDSRIRCDYLVQIQAKKKEEDNKNIFIELKGSDVKHAAKQISATIFSAEVKVIGGSISRCLIVSSKVPLAASELFSIKKEFLKNHSCSLEIKNSVMEIQA